MWPASLAKTRWRPPTMDQRGGAEPRAETEDELDAGLLLVGANRRDPSGLQHREAQSLGFEIVEKQTLPKPRLCRNRDAIDTPIRVGQFDAAPADRTGGAGDQAARLIGKTRNSHR